MDIVGVGKACEDAGYVPVDRHHFFYSIFREEKENENRVFFVKERRLFFNVLMVEHPFDVEKIKLFEIPLVEIENARKQKISMVLYIPPNKGYLPNHEGEEALAVLSSEQ